MLNIGTKKYRNLQEQVGYNTECIKKLADAIDGITIEDKLVVIDSDSGTFTDEELVILSGPLAFISDGSTVWMKQSETLVQLVFKAIQVVATEVESTYFNLGLSQIVVNRETGAYNTSSDTFFATYSKSQIDSIMSAKANASDVYLKTQTYSQTEVDNALATKADLAGASFTGPITAPNILENAPAYVATKAGNALAQAINVDYCGIVKTGNKITFAIAGSITPTEDIPASTDGTFITFTGIPSSVGSKIIPINASGHVSYKNVDAFKNNFVSTAKLTFVFAKNYNTSFFTYVFVNGQKLDAGATYFFRYEETFLLSDNLVS